MTEIPNFFKNNEETSLETKYAHVIKFYKNAIMLV